MTRFVSLSLLLLLGGVLLFALTASGGTGQINVTATLTHSVSHPAGRPGRQSDSTEQAWRVTDRQGRPIGRMLLQCRWLLARARYCSGEIQLPRGRITMAGSSATTFEGEYAVTGGTGRYRGAGGVMLFTAIGVHKTVLLISITT